MKNYTVKYTYQCDNKWDEMEPTGNGRHCGSCNKVVVDFTQIPDKDIIQYLLKNTHTCGLFRKNQLNRSMVLHPVKRRSNWPAIAALLIAGMVTVAPASLQAVNQTKAAIEYHPLDDKKVEPEKTKQTFTIQLLSANTNIPILFGSVYVEGLGNFFGNDKGIIQVINTLEKESMPDSLQITVSAGGYTTKVFSIYTKDLEKTNGANIYLEEMKQGDISPPGTVAIHEEEPPKK
jgi:hypothetical protein